MLGVQGTAAVAGTLLAYHLADLLLATTAVPLYCAVYGKIGGIAHAVGLLLRPHSPEVVVTVACLALARLARFEVFKVLMSAHAPLLHPGLVALLDSRSPAVVHAASLTLAELCACSTSTRAALGADGALHAIFAHIDAAVSAAERALASSAVATAAAVFARAASLFRAAAQLLLARENRVLLFDALLASLDGTPHHPSSLSVDTLTSLFEVASGINHALLSTSSSPTWAAKLAPPDAEALPAALYALTSLVAALAEGVGSITDTGNDALVTLLFELPVAHFLLQAIALFASPLASLADRATASEFSSLADRLATVSPFTLALDAAARGRGTSALTSPPALPPATAAGLLGATHKPAAPSLSMPIVSISVEGSRMAVHALALLARFPLFADWMALLATPPSGTGRKTSSGTLLLYALRDVLSAPALADEAYCVGQVLSVVGLAAAHKSSLMLASLFPHLIHLLGSPASNPCVAGAAAGTLIAIAQAEGTDVVASLLEDDLDAIHGLLASRHAGLHGYGVGLVIVVAETEAGRIALGRSPCLRALMGMVVPGADAQNLVLVCLAVGLLSLNLTNAIRMVAGGLLSPLVALATSSASRDMRLQFLASWVLVSLLAHATSASNKAAHDAAGTAAVIASVSSEWRELVSSIVDDARATGLLPQLPAGCEVWRSEAHFPVHHLTRLSQASPDLEVRTWLAWALSWLSFQDDYHGPFASSLLRTIHILGETESRHVQSGVAVTLYNMCRSLSPDLHAALVADPRIVPLLEKLAGSHYQDTRDLAQDALSALREAEAEGTASASAPSIPPPTGHLVVPGQAAS
ncbi:uncharacterized protein AMSG_10394 [Thecamonas trahens ATCC 50062]|uniref:Uncharacterized protein n=1 Tax=Thecamonas trahens ATCC 50062 TaxID=461836 RepID=A0A0L0DQJ4_THETB|nr:hypothetical protein AMSG_10394 [Thecamonas trahens ATCC 50062]KNC54545.1 hypothetical protein AMSG_10394 [Thecamonas trahens ATCC 50062]|eukprot:XP_013753560.1 hypothetical protein AMSG_10394 [Thecamonas trahens ATCC 50062]